MSTPAAIMATAAALLNDQAQDVYTNTVLTPYFNVALKDLQEQFELNNVPCTNDTSAVINLDAGVVTVGFATTPALPSDLIELRQVWESPEGLAQYTRMTPKDFIPQNLLDGNDNSQFLIYAWEEQLIKLAPCNQDIDLKLNYIKSIFTAVTSQTLATNIPIINMDSYMHYHLAALAAMFIGENPERAAVLEDRAERALQTELGISAKGRQGIVTRRRPFRAAYKMRSWV